MKEFLLDFLAYFVGFALIGLSIALGTGALFPNGS